ncbi:putative lipid II flippase FtsW [Lachnospiraceae bacterium]|nr:putative lipid II flippase FtsW [Lachnospiraceae bacterium]
MGTVYHHGIRYRMESLRNRVDMKSIAIMLSIEFMLYFFVIYKGFGWNYLPIIVFMMFFTIVSSAVASYMGADRYLLVIIILLLNLGFVVQEIESGNGVKISSFLLKFGLAVAAAFLAALLYKYLAGILIDDKIVLGIMTIQLLVCITMYTVGVRIGDMNRQGAVLTINVKGISITPFEIVKVLYLLVIAALLCKEESKMLYLGKWRIGKETFLMIHTGILSIFFLLCRELGTLLVIYLVEVIMLWIFGKNRKQIFMLLAFTVIGIGGVWFICDQILCPIVIAGKIHLIWRT